MPKNKPEAKDMVMVDQTTGKIPDASVLEDAGIAFDPANLHLDLDKNEKRRVTALMLAINAYQHLIIKDADYYMAVKRDETCGGAKIQPATMDAMLEAAINFDAFIAGEFEKPNSNQQYGSGPALPPPEDQ